MKHHFVRMAALICCYLSLTGCAALGALNAASEPGDAYELRPPPGLPIAASARSEQLVIDLPTASGAIDTDRVLVRPNTSQVQYLPGARWTQAAPVMIQTVLVEIFLRTGGFQFVGQRPIGPVSDIILVTHLSDFGVEFDPASGEGNIVVTLVANVVREDDATIIASRRFSRRTAISETATPAVIAGFESVSGAIFVDLADWVLRVRGVTRRS
ncbi:MAG: ABC-type transport auxiliary lipoprotein family protein [Pseudomonadota bacterium]